MSRASLLLASLALALACSSDDSSLEAADGGTSSSDGGNVPAPDADPTAPDATPGVDPCGTTAGVDRVDLSHEGRDRGAQVHVPSSYSGQPTPVVINFHGRNSTASQQRALTQMDADANSAGYISVYPEGVGNTFNAGFCCGEAQTQNIDDVGYSRALIDELANHVCIDRSKIYSTGLSNGGYMTQRLACEASDLFAGYASVAGLLATAGCSPSEPKPIVHFHGTSDIVVPYDGNAFLQSAQDTMDAWATRNGCTTSTSEVFSQGDASCVAYQGCPIGAGVELCTIDEGGHTWPGGISIPGLGNTSTDISANQYMWQFFSTP